MRRTASLAAAVAIALLLGASPGQAAPADRGTAETAISAQAQADGVRKRPRTRIQVSPRYPRRNYHTLYPLPYNEIAYPGPNAVRLCTSRLVQEHRPSGTVIVPRMRCWWARR